MMVDLQKSRCVVRDSRSTGGLLSRMAGLQEGCCQGWQVYRRAVVRDGRSTVGLLSVIVGLQKVCCQGR